MITVLLIFNLILVFWIFVLNLKAKEHATEVADIIRWNAYLETVLKDSQILVFNTKKGKHGEYEINNKLIDFLK